MTYYQLQSQYRPNVIFKIVKVNQADSCVLHAPLQKQVLLRYCVQTSQKNTVKVFEKCL